MSFITPTSAVMFRFPSGSPSSMSVPALYTSTSGWNSPNAAFRFLRSTSIYIKARHTPAWLHYPLNVEDLQTIYYPYFFSSYTYHWASLFTAVDYLGHLSCKLLIKFINNYYVGKYAYNGSLLSSVQCLQNLRSNSALSTYIFKLCPPPPNTQFI